MASSTLYRWLHRSINALGDRYQSRKSSRSPRRYDRTAVFSNAETVSAYIERLDTTTLPFAIDATQIASLVPSHQGTEYVVLDNACGTGAAMEWIINEFNRQRVTLDITATDHSAVMMNEVTKRRERLNWGDNVKSILMDAQVCLL